MDFKALAVCSRLRISDVILRSTPGKFLMPFKISQLLKCLLSHYSQERMKNLSVQAGDGICDRDTSSRVGVEYVEGQHSLSIEKWIFHQKLCILKQIATVITLSITITRRYLYSSPYNNGQKR